MSVITRVPNVTFKTRVRDELVETYNDAIGLGTNFDRGCGPQVADAILAKFNVTRKEP